MVELSAGATVRNAADLERISAQRSPGQPTSITLSANSCYKVGDTVTVLVSKGASTTAASGGQFFISYNTAVLNYTGGDPGDGTPGNPYTLEVFDHCHGASRRSSSSMRSRW